MEAFDNVTKRKITPETFDKPIGMIAEACVEYDNAAAEEIKAELYALLQAEDRLDESDLPKNNYGELNAFALGAEKREELAAKAGITDEEMDAARAEVAKADFSGEGMPLYGDILVANGFVQRDVKNALLMVQACVRTLDITSRIEKGEARRPERAFDFSKFGAFDDPVPLTTVQLMHRAAYEKEVAVFEGRDDMLKVEGFKKTAFSALENAAQILDKKTQNNAAMAVRNLYNTEQPAPGGTAPAPAQ